MPETPHPTLEPAAADSPAITPWRAALTRWLETAPPAPRPPGPDRAPGRSRQTLEVP